MGLRQCEKCTEMVDEAKAFCPACGHALVEEEKRTGQSDFEAMDSTVQLGQTMYNQMLSDLGLDLGKSAEKAEKRVEVLAPEPIEPVSARPLAQQIVQPAAPPPPQTGRRPTGSTNTLKWLLIGGALLLFLFIALVIAATILIWMWRPGIPG